MVSIWSYKPEKEAASIAPKIANCCIVFDGRLRSLHQCLHATKLTAHWNDIIAWSTNKVSLRNNRQSAATNNPEIRPAPNVHGDNPEILPVVNWAHPVYASGRQQEIPKLDSSCSQVGVRKSRTVWASGWRQAILELKLLAILAQEVSSGRLGWASLGEWPATTASKWAATCNPGNQAAGNCFQRVKLCHMDSDEESFNSSM